MIYIPPILELSMFGVVEAGIPNRERVCLRPTDNINLAQFGIMAGIRGEKGITPIPNIFLWFGEINVQPPAWIIVFTGQGQPQPSPVLENGVNIYVFYWNLHNTIFNIPNVVPVAFKIQSILTGHNIQPAGKQIKNTQT